MVVKQGLNVKIVLELVRKWRNYMAEEQKKSEQNDSGVEAVEPETISNDSYTLPFLRRKRSSEAAQQDSDQVEMQCNGNAQVAPEIQSDSQAETVEIAESDAREDFLAAFKAAATKREADLRQQLAQSEEQVAQHKDQWLRATADFKNYKRRAENERSELVRSANAALILKLLPVVDDFDLAIENVPPEVAATAWWAGTQLIAQKLRLLLESEGVTPLVATGQDFDPNLHDAVVLEETEGQDGKVLAELQKGYKQYDRVLRPAKVKVGKG